MSDESSPNSEIILYQTGDGGTRLQVRLQDETVWLTQKLMAELFQTSVPNVSMHIRNVFAEGELQAGSVVKEFLTTAADGKSYTTQHYNLDVIISVGYRVKSLRGTQFRIWATQRLREYIVKGFTLDDERLKESGGGAYFDELLERIRDIRSSEKVFWRKVLDIYATSADYDPRAEASQLFFATVQNKMHWAAHRQTAAEVIAARADAGKPNMGLTTWQGARPRKPDVAVAKNYLRACLKTRPVRAPGLQATGFSAKSCRPRALTRRFLRVFKHALSEQELGDLNLIVSLYLDFAELQARSRRVMTMRDWITKLDEFLKLPEHELLDHAGKITAEQAKMKAELEYDRYRTLLDSQPRAVDLDFEKAVTELKKLPKAKKPRLPKK